MRNAEDLKNFIEKIFKCKQISKKKDTKLDKTLFYDYHREHHLHKPDYMNNVGIPIEVKSEKELYDRHSATF